MSQLLNPAFHESGFNGTMQTVLAQTVKPRGGRSAISFSDFAANRLLDRLNGQIPLENRRFFPAVGNVARY
jgi:hypothetical protein